jgi:uncharacterized protein YndB with AHSA1/START domain
MAKIKTGGKIGFKIAHTYRSSLEKVWNAATQAKHINKYFTDGSKGDFTEDLKPVKWAWKSWGSAELHVTECIPMQRVQWWWSMGDSGYANIVTFEFSRQKGRVLLSISETGWKSADLDDAFGRCNGWTDFLDYLKAYLYFGKDLRK